MEIINGNLWSLDPQNEHIIMHVRKYHQRVDPRAAKFYRNMIKCTNIVQESLYPTIGDEDRVGLVYKRSKEDSKREIQSVIP